MSACVGRLDEALGPFLGIPRPQRTYFLRTYVKKSYLFKDLYKEIILRNPKKGRFFGVQVGFRALRPEL